MTAPALEDLLRELTQQVLGALVRRHGYLESRANRVRTQVLPQTLH